MKKINLILLTAILIVVLLAIEIIIVRSASEYEPEVEVIFAKIKIDEGTTITTDMLVEKKINLSYAHKQSIKKTEEVAGKKAKVDIEEGEMILNGKLADIDEMDKLTIMDNSNRLFSVEFRGDQANGWWLKAGQYVDIIFVPNAKGNMEADDVQKSIEKLRNIRIAAIIDEKGRLIKDSESGNIPRYISFELSDSQCDFLAYAKGNGRLEISLIPE